MTDEHGVRPFWGWAGSVRAFLQLDRQAWLGVLQEHFAAVSGESPGRSQLDAWRNCHRVLDAALTSATQSRPEAAKWSLAFEYELPRERGRRPDLLVITSESMAILEFKDSLPVTQANVDQVSAYARDLGAYHAGSHELSLLSAVVLTRAHGAEEKIGHVSILSPEALSEFLIALSGGETSVEFLKSWLAAPYAPLPSLVAAARRIFKHEPLPSIRRAQSAGVEETVKSLVAIAKEARTDGGRHLALVTGAPGAGKTLVGLKFVYEDSLTAGGGGRTAVFLSGNGPLITVLQHALKTSIFVQDVHGFLKEYGSTGRGTPAEHIWVYDEAQRAWDADRVASKNRGALSEPQDFVALGERVPEWAMLVGLIGEGQEIHIGEEAGMAQWNEAVAGGATPWIVHCPELLRFVFKAAAEVRTDESLSLNESLRSHLASDVDDWINAVLRGQLGDARRISDNVQSEHFDMYVVRDLEMAKSYVRERYAAELDKRYGLLASSKAKNLPAWGLQNDWTFTRRLRQGPWYNDPPESKDSCCQLREVATEFSSQGLELDFPIVCWGSDLRWSDQDWLSPKVGPRTLAKDPHSLRINSYRVLLSRGRDGFCVFVPPEPAMDSTFHALRSAGLGVLGEISLRQIA